MWHSHWVMTWQKIFNLSLWLWLWKTTAIIGHVTIRLLGSTSYGWSIMTMRLSSTVTEIWRLKDNGVTSLTFWGHVTSSITWPFDSRGSTSYGWSIMTMRLSVMEIWPFEVLPGRLFQEQRSVVDHVSSVGLQYYTDVIYSSSLR